MARVVVQRVLKASVAIEEEVIASIAKGLAILVGIRQNDTSPAVDRLADKVASLRVFEDAQGKTNLSTADVGGSMLVVSQFTLYGNVKKGRRPSFIEAAGPDLGRALYKRFAERLASHGYQVECGQFGAHMVVALENDGPVTLVIDSEEL